MQPIMRGSSQPYLFFFLPLVLLALILPAAAQEPSPVRARVLERLHADGVDIPDARVLFFWDEAEAVCVALGIKEGPGEIRPGFIVFEGRIEGDAKPVRLKFEFDKKAVRKEKGLLIWSSCLDGEAPVGVGDEVQFTVRRIRRETQTFVVELPGFGVAGGLDLWHGAEGELAPTVRITSLEEGGA